MSFEIYVYFLSLITLPACAKLKNQPCAVTQFTSLCSDSRKNRAFPCNGMFLYFPIHYLRPKWKFDREQHLFTAIILIEDTIHHCFCRIQVMVNCQNLKVKVIWSRLGILGSLFEERSLCCCFLFWQIIF